MRACRSHFVSQSLRPFLVSPRVEDLLVLTTLIETGKLTPVVDRSYPLSETPDAIHYVGKGHSHGKVVVTMRESNHRAAEAAGALRQQEQGHAQEMREIRV